MIRELQQIGRNFQNRFHPFSKFFARSTEEISRNLMFPFLMFEFLCARPGAHHLARHICVIKRLQVQFGIHKRKEILCSIRESLRRELIHTEFRDFLKSTCFRPISMLKWLLWILLIK